MQTEHHMQRMTNPPEPANDQSSVVIIDGRQHHITDAEAFDRLVYPDCVVTLPDGAGWATTDVALGNGINASFATWVEAAS